MKISANTYLNCFIVSAIILSLFILIPLLLHLTNIFDLKEFEKLFGKECIAIALVLVITTLVLSFLLEERSKKEAEQIFLLRVNLYQKMLSRWNRKEGSILGTALCPGVFINLSENIRRRFFPELVIFQKILPSNEWQLHVWREDFLEPKLILQEKRLIGRSLCIKKINYDSKKLHLSLILKIDEQLRKIALDLPPINDRA